MGDASPSESTSVQRPKFEPTDRVSGTPDIALPNETWLTVLDSPCTFGPEIFHEVMLNLIKNPNITSSHLFRADIFYDSDSSSAHRDLLRHLKAEYQPRKVEAPEGFEHTRTIVRQLVPRNPQVDRPLVQTCHFLQGTRPDENDLEEELTTVIYVPHVDKAEDVPFYHPAVSKVAFRHQWAPHRPDQPGVISVSYTLFPQDTLSTKLSRTALRLLQTIHKHGQGQLTGYEKRVHHDQIIPQKRYQDTYTRLKATYGRQISQQWVEVTDPAKHVFEDIGIAAFLIEMWRDMYYLSNADEEKQSGANDSSLPPFPGFVDIGCGNGLLTYILISEGYSGWGFDARERKTWSIFPAEVREHLSQRLLVPNIFWPADITSETHETSTWHNGIFSQSSPQSQETDTTLPGPFIISNHADELTAWTPLLAALNGSAFIAIPCCSHDLSGARFRAPVPRTSAKHTKAAECSTEGNTNKHAAEAGSLKTLRGLSSSSPTNNTTPTSPSNKASPTQQPPQVQSAYATLCTYVASLATLVGYAPIEHEHLRIPSTRNRAIIGRTMTSPSPSSQGPAEDPSPSSSTIGQAQSDDIEKNLHDQIRQLIIKIVERELGKRIEQAGGEWRARAEGLAKKPGSGH